MKLSKLLELLSVILNIVLSLLKVIFNNCKIQVIFLAEISDPVRPPLEASAGEEGEYFFKKFYF
jgi:hypothetical protein